MPKCTSGREKWLETRELLLDGAQPHLHIQEEQGVLLFGPSVHPLRECIAVPHAIPAVLARIPLRHGRDEMQRRLHRCGGIGACPGGDFPIETGQHLLLGILAQHAHAFGERIAVIRDDAFGRQHTTRQRRGTGHGPHRRRLARQRACRGRRTGGGIGVLVLRLRGGFRGRFRCGFRRRGRLCGKRRTGAQADHTTCRTDSTDDTSNSWLKLPRLLKSLKMQGASHRIRRMNGSRA